MAKGADDGGVLVLCVDGVVEAILNRSLFSGKSMKAAPGVRADAQVTEIASETILSAKTSDLSLGGCFLDMLNPSPEGTEIAVRISHSETTFTARGKVVFVFPNMGMGVMFTSVPASQQAVLEKWLAKLSGGEG